MSCELVRLSDGGTASCVLLALVGLRGDQACGARAFVVQALATTTTDFPLQMTSRNR